MTRQCVVSTRPRREQMGINSNLAKVIKQKARLSVSIVIYVTQHCRVCEYSYEVADTIRRDFPQVNVRLVDMQTTSEEIPESVFATPTYLLNGQVWSLGNPSPEDVNETLTRLTHDISKHG